MPAYFWSLKRSDNSRKKGRGNGLLRFQAKEEEMDSITRREDNNAAASDLTVMEVIVTLWNSSVAGVGLSCKRAGHGLIE